ncbi:hypothetical protein B0H15DRAFT_958260 [Mycena belliarum]|uniref:Uncharacterized protein n=1 Tax=Mycena belliarum TaxID=1033014 RepID=A0AAD6TQI1_9AGAR|nr:hypothetical protein B0H15DRAFT_958260 [Mycena belliae]
MATLQFDSDYWRKNLPGTEKLDSEAKLHLIMSLVIYLGRTEGSAPHCTMLHTRHFPDSHILTSCSGLRSGARPTLIPRQPTLAFTGLSNASALAPISYPAVSSFIRVLWVRKSTLATTGKPHVFDRARIRASRYMRGWSDSQAHRGTASAMDIMKGAARHIQLSLALCASCERVVRPTSVPARPFAARAAAALPTSPREPVYLRIRRLRRPQPQSTTIVRRPVRRSPLQRRTGASRAVQTSTPRRYPRIPRHPAHRFLLQQSTAVLRPASPGVNDRRDPDLPEPVPSRPSRSGRADRITYAATSSARPSRTCAPDFDPVPGLKTGNTPSARHRVSSHQQVPPPRPDPPCPSTPGVDARRHRPPISVPDLPALEPALRAAHDSVVRAAPPTSVLAPSKPPRTRARPALRALAFPARRVGIRQPQPVARLLDLRTCT